MANTCNKCGLGLKDGDKFCGYCGAGAENFPFKFSVGKTKETFPRNYLSPNKDTGIIVLFIVGAIFSLIIVTSILNYAYHEYNLYQLKKAVDVFNSSSAPLTLTMIWPNNVQNTYVHIALLSNGKAEVTILYAGNPQVPHSTTSDFLVFEVDLNFPNRSRAANLNIEKGGNKNELPAAKQKWNAELDYSGHLSITDN